MKRVLLGLSLVAAIAIGAAPAYSSPKGDCLRACLISAQNNWNECVRYCQTRPEPCNRDCWLEFGINYEACAIACGFQPVINPTAGRGTTVYPVTTNGGTYVLTLNATAGATFAATLNGQAVTTGSGSKQVVVTLPSGSANLGITVMGGVSGPDPLPSVELWLH